MPGLYRDCGPSTETSENPTFFVDSLIVGGLSLYETEDRKLGLLYVLPAVVVPCTFGAARSAGRFTSGKGFRLPLGQDAGPEDSLRRTRWGYSCYTAPYTDQTCGKGEQRANWQTAGIPPGLPRSAKVMITWLRWVASRLSQ